MKRCWVVSFALMTFMSAAAFFRPDVAVRLVQLNKALQLSPAARDARSHISFVFYLKGDFGSACTWAEEASRNGDGLEKGYPEDMCSRDNRS